jgi:hypothetical protein
VQFDLFELVLNNPALIDDLLPLQLCLLDLKGHTLIIVVKLLNFLLELLDLGLCGLDHILHLRLQNRLLMGLLLGNLGRLGGKWKIKMGNR